MKTDGTFIIYNIISSVIVFYICFQKVMLDKRPLCGCPIADNVAALQ